MKKIVYAMFALMLPLTAIAADSATQWSLTSSTLTYKIVFPMHHPQGISREGTGKGITAPEGCTFDVTAPIKSFDSGNKKRDHEMMIVMRGETNPDVVVTATFPQLAAAGEEFKTNLKVSMSGETSTYSDVAFKVVSRTEGSFEVEGVIPMLLEDFKVTRPSLMGVKVKNLCPVTVKATWTADPTEVTPAAEPTPAK